MWIPLVGGHKRRRPADEGGPSASATVRLWKAIERRFLEERGQDRRRHEKDAVDRFLGVVAHRLDPNQALGTQHPGVKQACPASVGCYVAEIFLGEMDTRGVAPERRRWQHGWPRLERSPVIGPRLDGGATLYCPQLLLVSHGLRIGV